jgi:hypothetical protein
MKLATIDEWWVDGMHEFMIDSQVFCPTWIDETNLWIISSQEKYENENFSKKLC